MKIAIFPEQNLVRKKISLVYTFADLSSVWENESPHILFEAFGLLCYIIFHLSQKKIWPGIDM